MKFITLENWEEENIKRHKDTLNPDWNSQTLDPLSIKDMEKSIERIYLAIKHNEKIVIYSDYDCDGIPGGVVLYDFFKKIKYNNFMNYIPHRHNEGYGIHIKALDDFIRNGYTLMITVDLGITNLEEVQYAEEGGLNVIVTDHHLPIEKEGKQVLPKSFAVINTKRSDCEYANKLLCGCATAWKLAYAFLVKYGKEFEVEPDQAKWWLDMVGVSTIADMVPLTGENRILAKYGLDVLNKTKRHGLRKIFNNGKEKIGSIDETSVSFTIAPRLNSAGRMADPKIAFEALAYSIEPAIEAATTLETLNSKRKDDVKIANESLNFEDFTDKNVIVTGNKEWTPGILGLIAQKIVDNTGKTVFVWGAGEDLNLMKGSVRSGSGSNRMNVVQAMSNCSHLLSHYGGHEEAGGFSINKDFIADFELALNKNFSLNTSEDVKDLVVIPLDPKEINLDLLNVITRYKPFGVGNPAPLFAVKDDFNIRKFGSAGQHLEVTFLANPKVKAIKWNIDESFLKKIKKDSYIIGNISQDKYKGGLQLMIIDIQN